MSRPFHEPEAVLMSVELRRHRFTVEQYRRMAEAGIFSEDDRVELLEGEIVRMNPIGSPHAGCVKRLNSLFAQRLGLRVVIGVQDPLRLGDYSEPEPDLMLLRPRPDFYSESHPEPPDVLLIVEVAWSSLAEDRRVKVPLYARFGIPECWLVDVDARRLVVYREPSIDGYRSSCDLGRGERFTLLAFPDVEVAVEEALG
jgi:Uma2 family endonuclease